ncbi:Carboxypeptidase [Aphelenchoides bicaudatus]|nr:Carboxypeptidase [Aphelenchoides bicaudatus]
MWLEWLYLLYLFIGLVSAYTRADASADLVNSLPDYKGPTLTFKQYAGYLELSSGNALFYWLTKSPKQSDPVILWLSGGPGCSSTFALLTEHGPYRLKDDGQSLTYNPYAWNQYAHMIYLDAPAGVGFSLNRNKQYNFTDTQVAQNNMEALERFFDKFPELIFNDLYISGESYGGTYVPMLGSLISKNTNKFPTFKGIIVGNGCLHEKIRFNSQIPFNYNHDFISDKFYNSAVEKCCKKPASECDWYNLYENSGDDCFYIIDQLQNANFYSGLDPYFINYACYLDDSAPKKPSKTPRNTYFQFRRKNLQKVCNILNSSNTYGLQLDSQQSCADETDTEVYLNRADVKAALHVPSDVKFESCSDMVADYYIIEYEDMGPFVKDIVVDSTRRSLFFNGDMIEKRGYRCLWDERVYYCISVENWFRRLVFMASVQWYDENEDEDTCLVSPTVKGRLTAARKSKNKLKLKDAHLIQVLCSLINKETTASNDPFIYNRDYEAAHTCQFKRCVNVYHIRRTTKAENWNEHVELNLVWFFDQLGLPLVQERTAWLYNKKLPKTSDLDFVTVVGAGHFVSAASEKPRENLQIFVNFLRNRDYSTPI